MASAPAKLGLHTCKPGYARGYNVNVANAGISGDTTAGMLARLDSAVPPGTRVVVYGIYNSNDARHGISPA